MLRDGILETSTSPILNPLTVVNREGKKIRICVDARKVNQFTMSDREHSPLLHELLQRFNGARYLTSLDLSQDTCRSNYMKSQENTRHSCLIQLCINL
jgi:hypothetical protein